MAGKKSAELIQHFLKANSSRVDKQLDKVKVVEAGDGGCVAELTIEKEHTNQNGTLHGGFSATLIDTLASYGLLTHKNCGVPAVTIDLHTTYLKGASIGEEIVITSKTVRTGKTIAYLEAIISNKKSGEPLVTGVLSRFLLRPQD